MPTRIAIQPDYIRHRNGEEQSFSARWSELASQRGFDVRTVDVYEHDVIEQLRECDGFMWRFGFDALSLQFAKRLLPAVEHGLRIPVFPSCATAWHFEDKIAQRYLLQAAGTPVPRTWVFWDREDALAFCRSAPYPLVAKLSTGFQSRNVRRLEGADEAAALVRRLFGEGATSLDAPQGWQRLLGSRKQAVRLLAGKALPRGIQHGYVYLQEWLEGNPFDTRVTVIGNRAFAFRRLNRPGDFRASGSGRIEWDPAAIDLPTVRMAFRIARTLGTQSVAIDGLRRGDERVVGEISYTYASWAVRDCPGHWVLDGPTEDGPLRWVEGRMRPEDAIFEDFAAMLAHGRPGPLLPTDATVGAIAPATVVAARSR